MSAYNTVNLLNIGCLTVIWTCNDIRLVLLDIWIVVKLTPSEEKLPSKGPTLFGLKMMKNAFDFVLEVFKFLFLIFCHAGKRLDQKTKVNFKMYDVTNWVAIIKINIYQISYEVKAIRQRNLSPVPLLFQKIKIQHISVSIVWSSIQFFLMYVQVKDYRNILKVRC